MRRFLAFLAAAAALALVARAALRRAGLFPVRVAGESMLPTLRPGDLLAASPVREQPVARGTLVIVRDSSGLEVVKRVAMLEEKEAPSETRYWLLGDNADASTDSRTHGLYGEGQLVGIVRARYWPPLRFRVFTS